MKRLRKFFRNTTQAAIVVGILTGLLGAALAANLWSWGYVIGGSWWP